MRKKQSPVTVRASICLVPLLLALLAFGCVTKGTHEALQAELEACQTNEAACATERDDLSTELADLREEQQEVLDEWREELGISGEGTAAFREGVEGQVEVIKTRITDDLPDMVRAQLGRDLEQLTDLLDSQFSDIDNQYSEMLGRMVTTQESLDDANRALTRAEIRLEAIQTTGEAIRDDIAGQRLDAATLDGEVKTVAALIEDFNYRYFLCKECPEYLGIRRKRQNEIMAFHADLLSALHRVSGVAPIDTAEAAEEESEEGR